MRYDLELGCLVLSFEDYDPEDVAELRRFGITEEDLQMEVDKINEHLRSTAATVRYRAVN
jgi:hypothetical protein